MQNTSFFTKLKGIGITIYLSKILFLRVSQPGLENPSIKAPCFSFAQRKNENRKEKKNSIFIILNCIAEIISPQAGFKIQAKL
ncbi:MAG: hypothetical protein CMI23_09950 [Opitutae bacterium]|nr:hypothetical protein [Opitutae bacterium]